MKEAFKKRQITPTNPKDKKWLCRVCHWLKKSWKVLTSIGVIIGIISGFLTINDHIDKEYKIIYHNANIDDQHYTRKDSVCLGVPEGKNGYNFIGWFGSPDLVGDPLSIIPKGSMGKKEFWAKWAPEEYTIQFFSHGGLPIFQDTTYTIESDDVMLPQGLKKSGYHFKGWTIGWSTIVVDRILKGSIGDKKLWALWEKVPTGTTITLSDDQDNGTSVLPPMEFSGSSKDQFSRQDAIDAAFKDAFNRLKLDVFPNEEISILMLNATPIDTLITKPYEVSDTWDATVRLSISRILNTD